mmetsp:Transcript_54032/g.132470  ORF Transcript_54032/g.132470 Transcript_54032/m.132470 type:complete len:232 (+) Transcript_54032:74-769(+)
MSGGASSGSHGAVRLGDEAPNFTAETTEGEIDFHKWAGDSWVLLVSHPADHTPVCTTELGTLAKLQDEFKKRNVKTIGLSVDSKDDHEKWSADINKVMGCTMNFPLIADKNREVATKYGMLDRADSDNVDAKGMPLTVRSVFIITPAKKVALILTYPASCGRNFDEVLRAVDSLQLTANKQLCTPANWKAGGDLVVAPSVSTEAAKEKYGADNVDVKLPYLRMVPASAADK